MKKRIQLILVVTMLALINIACSTKTPMASSPYSCGKYGPNVAISPSADLKLTATAQFGTPGVAMSATFVEQGGWFLLDDFGAGTLMGCQPTQSYLMGERDARNNTYDENGMLIQQTTTRDSGTPATLTIQYDPENPFRVVYAEQFCYGLVDTKLNRFTFTYTEDKLTQILIEPDADCPLSGPVTVTYSYNSTTAPNLPSEEVIVEDDGDTATNTYTYNVTAGQLKSIETSMAGTFVYTYTDDLMTGMLWPHGIRTISYRGDTQWKSMIDERFGWGLTVDYNGDNTVESTLQNTGCPGCTPSTYAY